MGKQEGGLGETRHEVAAASEAIVISSTDVSLFESHCILGKHEAVGSVSALLADKLLVLSESPEKCSSPSHSYYQWLPGLHSDTRPRQDTNEASRSLAGTSMRRHVSIVDRKHSSQSTESA